MQTTAEATTVQAHIGAHFIEPEEVAETEIFPTAHALLIIIRIKLMSSKIKAAIRIRPFLKS